MQRYWNRTFFHSIVKFCPIYLRFFFTCKTKEERYFQKSIKLIRSKYFAELFCYFIRTFINLKNKKCIRYNHIIFRVIVDNILKLDVPEESFITSFCFWLLLKHLLEKDLQQASKTKFHMYN